MKPKLLILKRAENNEIDEQFFIIQGKSTETFLNAERLAGEKPGKEGRRTGAVSSSVRDSTTLERNSFSRRERTG